MRLILIAAFGLVAGAAMAEDASRYISTIPSLTIKSRSYVFEPKDDITAPAFAPAERP